MRTAPPAKTTDVHYADFFVFQRDPITRMWTCYRAGDGFEVGSDASFEDCVYRSEVFQEIYNGDLF